MSGRGWDGVTLGREEYQRALREHAESATADLRARLDVANKRIAEMEAALDKALQQRDDREEQVGDMAAQAGCGDEFSNLHDHRTCVGEAFGAVDGELTRLRASIPTPEALAEALIDAALPHFDHMKSMRGEALRSGLAKLAKMWMPDGGREKDALVEVFRDAMKRDADSPDVYDFLRLGKESIATGKPMPAPIAPTISAQLAEAVGLLREALEWGGPVEWCDRIEALLARIDSAKGGG